MSERQNQKSLKSRVRDELTALRQQEIAKNRRGKFKDEGSTFLTPEEATTYLAELRAQKKAKEQPTPPTNLPSSELNDWYSRQRKMQLDEQKKRVEAEKFLRGYRSKLEDLGKGGNKSPKRTKHDDDDDLTNISEQGVENVMLEVSKFESKSQGISTLKMKKEKDDNEIDDDVKEEEENENNEVVKEETLPDLNGDDLNEENGDDKEVEVKSTAEEAIEHSEVNNDENTTEDDVVETNEEVVEEDIVEETETPIESEEDALIDEPTETIVKEEKKEDVTEEEPVVVVVEPKVEKEIVQTEPVEEKVVEDTSDESWRDLISRQPGARFGPELDRYHLYVSHACPWAHRTVLVVALKGLEDVIGITYVHPTWQYTKPDVDEHRGWVFGSKEGDPLTSTSGSGNFPSSWGEEDPNMGAKTIRDIYEQVDDTTERYILPILWDKKLNTIVSNESSEIIRMLNSEFNEFAKNPDIDLYPESHASKIDEINQWIYPSFNNGVYRCGLASTQESYDVAIDELTEAFDKIDSILRNQRYIAGDVFTEADVRLFVTLIRFDEVYDIYFKTNTRSVASTPAVLNYVRDIYQMENVAKTCVMDMIKAHYYTSHVELNKYSIIPRGVNFIGLLDKAHNRESM